MSCLRGQDYHKKIIQLIDEVEILQRVEKCFWWRFKFSYTFQRNFCCGQCCKRECLTSLVINLLPSMLAKEAISPKKIDSLISSVKAASEASKRNSPTDRIEDTIKRIMVGQRVGLGLGVFLTKKTKKEPSLALRLHRRITLFRRIHRHTLVLGSLWYCLLSQSSLGHSSLRF